MSLRLMGVGVDDVEGGHCVRGVTCWGMTEGTSDRIHQRKTLRKEGHLLLIQLLTFHSSLAPFVEYISI